MVTVAKQDYIICVLTAAKSSLAFMLMTLVVCVQKILCFGTMTTPGSRQSKPVILSKNAVQKSLETGFLATNGNRKHCF